MQNTIFRAALCGACLLLLAAPAVPATADDATTFELYGGWYEPDADAVDAGPSFGLRASREMAPSLALEATVGHTWEVGIDLGEGTCDGCGDEPDLSFTFVDASAVWSPPAAAGGRTVPRLYAGVGWRFVHGDRGTVDDSATAHVGVGLAIAVTSSLYLRPDLRVRFADELPGEDADLEATFGVGWRF